MNDDEIRFELEKMWIEAHLEDALAERDEARRMYLHEWGGHTTHEAKRMKAIAVFGEDWANAHYPRTDHER